MNEPVDRHVVVMDCNVYLDVASIVGAPYTRSVFDQKVAQLAEVPVPHPSNKAFDSLRAVAVCRGGSFAGSSVLEVWSSKHIHDVVEFKARQSQVPDATTGYRGLGWSADQARGLLEDLVDDLVNKTGGQILDAFADGTPPLDYEDGKVFGTCRKIAGDDPLANVYCITRDRGFLEASNSGQLAPHTKVLHPSQFVGLVRRARMCLAIGIMRPPNK